jgi:phage-related minor tail protein
VLFWLKAWRGIVLLLLKKVLVVANVQNTTFAIAANALIVKNNPEKFPWEKEKDELVKNFHQFKCYARC